MQPPPAPRRPLSKGGVGGSPRMGARGSAISDPRAYLGVGHRRPRREPSYRGGHVRADGTMCFAPLPE